MRYKIIILFLLLITSSIFSQEENNKQLIAKLNNRSYPQWFKDAKLGIFIHWGIYSVPSYGAKESYSEWFLRGLQTKDSLRTNFMKKHYGPDFTYKDFAPLFRAELFNPDEWAELFKASGAKYAVLVSKHHDGYALWPSKFSKNWNTVDIGPKRDIVGELSNSVNNAGLKMGLYYSLPEWNHPLHKWYTDPHDSIGQYVSQHMIPQFKELVSSYRPSLIFADGEWFNSAEQWHSAELIDWYYNLVGEEAIVNNRWGSGIDTGFLTPEYSSGISDTDRPWTEVRGIGRSFGLNRNEDLEAYGTAKELIQRFVQTVANGGGMILNVGPKADGQIPLIQQERLLQLGSWLKINGEAIYGSEPYIVRKEEKEVSITRIDNEINFDWVRNSPIKGIKEDDFNIEWTGYISAPTSGKYKLKLEADDQAVLYIDNQLIINQNFSFTTTDSEVMETNTSSSSIGEFYFLSEELYPIKINYRENKQNASIVLGWEDKNGNSEIIPRSSFFLNNEKTDQGIRGTYSSMKTRLCYTINNDNLYAISFNWPENQLQLSIPNPGDNAKVKLLGLDRLLPWTYDNGKMKIDVTSIKYSEMPSHDAWTFKISND